MSFAEPRLLWLLAGAPLAAAAAAWLWRRRLAAETVWAARGLWPRLRGGVEPRRWPLAVALLALAVAGTSLALARPRWGQSTEVVERQGVDIVFVLDSSLSMAAGDVAPSRFWVAQSLIRRLVAALPGNRVALVQVEGAGTVMSPLTVDAAVMDLLLDAAAPGSLPLPGTQLAPALERAATLFPEGGKKHRALVVVSDGEVHGEDLAAAAKRLKEAGIVVHTLGVGTENGAPIPIPGSPGAFKRDRKGQVVVSKLRPQVLRDLAERTEGLYFAATAASVDPTAVARRISAMEKRSLDSESVNTLEERFQWPLSGAALALALFLALSPQAAARNGRSS